MAKKPELKIDWNKGAVADAIAKDVASQATIGKSTWATMRGYVALVASGHLTPAHAGDLMAHINAKLAEHRKANHDTRVPVLNKQRVNELATIMKLGTYKCWPTVMDYVKDLDVNRGTLVTMVRFVRGEIKDKNNPVPPVSRERCLKALQEARKKKAGARNPNAPVNVTNPENTTQSMRRQAKGLRSWFGKDKAAADRFIAAVLNGIDAIEKAAKGVIKQREKEAAEAA